MNIFRFGLLLKTNFINRNLVASHGFSTVVHNSENSFKSRQVQPTYHSVADFYAGKSVFLTGATGFVGRLMIERLLSSCKDIDKVFILIRPKRHASIQQRVQELLDNPLFTKLKETRPQDLSKIVPIAGDISYPKLGISLEDEQTLIEKVSVIFHSAAIVHLTSSLSDLLQSNYHGTKQMMDLGKKMIKLDAFLYVSTAFHNSAEPIVEEIPYPSPRDIDDVYKVIAKHGDNPEEIKKQLFDKWGSSYLFTKKMAEGYVASNHGNMPTIIVRPSMVTSVYKEPLTGYTDSWVIGTGLLCVLASGVARVIYGNRDVIIDIIPADFVSNFLIAAAAKHRRTDKVGVYNITTGHANPIDWGKITDIYLREGKKNGYAIMPFPAVYFTKSTWMMPALMMVTEVLPAFVADTWLRLTGRRPRCMKLQKQAKEQRKLTGTGTAVSFIMKSTRARDLISSLNDKDKNTFPCDPKTIDWDEYIPIYCKGVKDYMIGKSKVK